MAVDLLENSKSPSVDHGKAIHEDFFLLSQNLSIVICVELLFGDAVLGKEFVKFGQQTAHDLVENWAVTLLVIIWLDSSFDDFLCHDLGIQLNWWLLLHDHLIDSRELLDLELNQISHVPASLLHLVVTPSSFSLSGDF